jgi:hypothetical protein
VGDGVSRDPPMSFGTHLAYECRLCCVEGSSGITWNILGVLV